MPKELELTISPDGQIESIYSDELKTMMESAGGEVAQICRASNVEWEDLAIDGKIQAGWTVRAAHDETLAIRMKDDQFVVSREATYKVVAFPSREQALQFEKQFFWDLIPKKGTT